ncbi:peptidoglycan D,D-transpeptidase FtsI family protein [Tessaracoccus coleopterorum]|uniref:peptidoglycan D,D-transpeptidase FtsI family protein n=1 Tax=Tessaracoccus coleopterorum TaxID=2714950 RepID=UPI0038CDB166
MRSNGADERYEMSKRKQEEAKAAPEAVAELLVKHLGGKKQTYLDQIAKKDSRYEIIMRRVPANTYIELKKDLKLGFDGDGKRPWWGVYATSDPVRTYPNRTVASNVIGWVNGDGEGASGLEYVLDDKLTGTPGKQVYDSSTYGRIPLGTSEMEPAVDGDSYVTTIDSDLQWMGEQALAEGLKKSGAKTGKLVVLNVDTGEVLALANGPSFDAANPGRADSDDLGNRAVTEAYEPGSVQKVLTMGALADQGLVTPDTKVVVPPRIASGDGSVGDSFDHGTINLTARGIIANSSNIGTIMLTREMDKADLSGYLTNFGLGSKSGLGLPGESAGSVPKPDMADYTRDQISFGQGLSVNAIQMAAAVAAVVNGARTTSPPSSRRARRPTAPPSNCRSPRRAA